MKEIDARKLACPAPVLLTREAIENENPEAIRVIVDNDASRQNVNRFLTSKAYEAKVETVGDLFHVIGTRQGGAAVAPAADLKPVAATAGDRKILVMITTDRMGFGDDTLGLKLMINFIGTLKEMGKELWRLILVNNGVKLAVEGSEVLGALEGFEKERITILVCGTCLTHYGLLEKKRVGETTNMLDIVTAMQLADKVITI